MACPDCHSRWLGTSAPSVSFLGERSGISPLRTRDVDLAFSIDEPLDGDIRKALINADFKEELTGEQAIPVTHYRLGAEDAGFFAEFVTTQKGSGFTRQGQRDLTVVKAGITAQRLRHVDLLLIAPWTVEVSPDSGVPIDRRFDLLVLRRST